MRCSSERGHSRRKLAQPDRRAFRTSISWDAAFDLVASRLHEIRTRHGRDTVGFYLGNPTGANMRGWTTIAAMREST
jgi:predicted molibdopterin-dependent oxidoreductase YjgC